MNLRQNAAALLFALASIVAAQETPLPSVPRVIRIQGTFTPQNGQPLSSVESVTLAIYPGEQDATPLWTETLNVVMDGHGGYNILMGATLPEGIPFDVLAGKQPRWLGIRFNRPGEPELPRSQMVSVPYAFKAADAELLGGRPASAYQLASSAAACTPDKPVSTRETVSAVKTTPKVTAGTAGYIGQFINATDLGNSILFQNPSAYLGIGTTTPAYALDIQALAAGPAAAVRIGNPAIDNRLRIESSQPYALGMRTGAGGTYAWMGVTGAGHYQFSDQLGNPLFLIQQGGNVGIGNTSPQFNLDVARDINAGGVLRLHGVPALQIGLLTGNTATGYMALPQNNTGANNTASGFGALAFNDSGSDNVATGGYALFANTTGGYNTASGYGALQSSTTGNYSTAFGYSALSASIGLGYNTAVGAYALKVMTNGQFNAAVGTYALAANTVGAHNTAAGHRALYGNAGGSGNTAIGDTALYAAGGDNNIALGFQAGSLITTHNNNIDIGHPGAAADDSVIRIGTPGTHGSFYAAGIRGVSTGSNDAVPVVIDSNGQLGTVSSSRRFKEDIRDMGTATSGLMKLRPVTFRYKEPFADGSKPVQFGLIAEEVAEVYPELIARGSDGNIETVKYQVLDAMLLNEIQRLQRAIERLESQVAALSAEKRRTPVRKAATPASQSACASRCQKRVK